jgi:nucleoside-diphosphate-sugar epimerase
MSPKGKVGIIGGASFVGDSLIPLLKEKGYCVQLFSRKGEADSISLSEPVSKDIEIENWIYLAPIWTLPEYLTIIGEYSGKRLIALSSTSRISKAESPDASERELAAQLMHGEERVKLWAKKNNCLLTIFQPTMIYGHGKDRNIASIARLIKRFGVFPLFGKGEGLRQPVHVDDIVSACVSALEINNLPQTTYILSGLEALTYRQMVTKIFQACGSTPRFFYCPLFLVYLAVWVAKLLPTYRVLTVEVAVRMNENLNFDNSKAIRDLNFTPRSFDLTKEDLYL